MVWIIVMFLSDVWTLKVRSHQTRINRAIRAKLDAWTFWVYSLHSHEKFAPFVREIRYTTDANTRHGRGFCRQLQSRCKMYSCFCKSRKMYILLGVPTYNHNYFDLHCCFGFSASACNDVTARASSWLVIVAQISAKFLIFQLARKKTLNSAAGLSFASLHWLNM